MTFTSVTIGYLCYHHYIISATTIIAMITTVPVTTITTTTVNVQTWKMLHYNKDAAQTLYLQHPQATSGLPGKNSLFASFLWTAVIILLLLRFGQSSCHWA
jgi:hypothetical protein